MHPICPVKDRLKKHKHGHIINFNFDVSNEGHLEGKATPLVDNTKSTENTIIVPQSQGLLEPSNPIAIET